MLNGIKVRVFFGKIVESSFHQIPTISHLFLVFLNGAEFLESAMDK